MLEHVGRVRGEALSVVEESAVHGTAVREGELALAEAETQRAMALADAGGVGWKDEWAAFWVASVRPRVPVRFARAFLERTRHSPKYRLPCGGSRRASSQGAVARPTRRPTA